MYNKLIMLVGACPGAGKSTLSAYLAEQLELNRLNTQWFYEEAVFYEPALMPLVELAKDDKLKFRDGVLTVAQEFTQQALGSGQVYVTDALFPGFQWLIEKNCSHAELKAFSQTIQAIFKPLNPILIYLNCNVPLALERAFKNRGEAYQQDLIAAMGRDSSRSGLLFTMTDLLNYWELNNRLNLELLKEWSGETLILNTTELTEPVCKKLILSRLGLEAQEPASLGELKLEKFTGDYLKTDPAPGAPARITVHLEDGQLRTNLYWPAGCRLVARSQTHFQLENIAQFLDFEVSPQEVITTLTYDTGLHVFSYTKV